MTASPEDLDGLYQVPLPDFTAARNDLAKRLGRDGASVKALPKPNLAAWTVNQLYWQRRPLYEAVVAASGRRREAHARILSGREGDVAGAESAHRDVLKAAMAAVRAILSRAGEPQSAATLRSVSDTLDALPGVGPAGRLSRPLAPLGFEALSGLVNAGPASVSARPVAPARPAARSRALEDGPAARERARVLRRAAETARRDAQARNRDVGQIEKRLRAARAAERLAEAAFTRARQSLAQNERERGRLEDQLKFVEKQALDLVQEIQRSETALAKATAERTQLERRLVALRG